MNQYIRQYPLDGGFNTHISKMGNAINANNISAGKGFKTTQTDHGTHFDLITKPNADAISYRGIYDFNSEYYPNEEVVILPNTVILDQNGSVIPIAAGTYLCVNYVPASANTSTAYLDIVSNYQGGNGSSDQANGYRWYNYNKYYPVATNPASVSVVVDSGYNIVANQTFWQPIGGGGGITWRGLFNESASYNVNDEVYVTSYHVYTASLYPSTASAMPALSVGGFICILPVPVSGSISGSSARNIYNCYYPFWPAIPATQSFKITATGSASGSVCNQNFWQPTSVPALPICMNGTTSFIAMELSGSVFNPNNLPYKGV